jgi:hypothetical protein
VGKQDKQDKYLEIEDTNIVAYLHYKGHDFVPFKKGKDRIAFKVYGSNTEADLSDMYRDTEIQTYLKCLKAVRSSLFTMKLLSQNEMEDEKHES